MKIYVYNRDGITKEVSTTDSPYYTAWDDFKKKYDWTKFYCDQEEEEQAREEFWGDIEAGVFKDEFDITEWILE